MNAQVQSTKSGPNQFSTVADYILQEGKVGYAFSGNIASLKTAAFEMRSTALLNPRVISPAYHVTISVSPKERLDRHQVKYIVRCLIESLGAADLQFIASQHFDTDHDHIHLLINRVSPIDGKALDTSFDFLRLRKVMDELEAQLGFGHSSHRDRSPFEGRRTRITSPWADASFQEWAASEVRAALATLLADRLSTWQTLHQLLASHGMTYEIGERGGLIVDAARPRLAFGASRLMRALSINQLKKRFGPFEFSESTANRDAAYSRRRIGTTLISLRNRYNAQLAEWRERQRTYRQERWQIQRNKEKERRKLMEVRYREAIETARSQPAGFRRAAVRLAKDRKSEDLAKLRVIIAMEHSRLRKKLGAQFPSFRGWLFQQSANGDIECTQYLDRLREDRQGLTTDLGVECKQYLELLDAADPVSVELNVLPPAWDIDSDDSQLAM